MREKTSEVVRDNEQFNFNQVHGTSANKKRLDLNDLLMRAKVEKKKDKKYNLLIFSGAASVVAVFYLLLNL